MSPVALALVALASAAAPDPAVSFTFVGQPDCVSLTFDGAHTLLENGCTEGVLVDQSVLLPGEPGPVVPPGEAARLADLSAFSLGLGGDLYRAVAQVAVAPAPVAEREEEPAPTPPTRPWRALVGAAFGFL